MEKTPDHLKHAALTERIIKIFYQVYNELGFGFLEAVYENAMAIALIEAGIKVVQQAPIPVYFRGRQVGDYRCDLLVEDKVILELKAVKAITPEHQAQVLHYFRATEIEDRAHPKLRRETRLQAPGVRQRTEEDERCRGYTRVKQIILLRWHERTGPRIGRTNGVQK